MRSHGAAFAPLPTWQEEEEPPTPQPHFQQPYNQPGQAVSTDMYNQYDPVRGNSTQIIGGQGTAQPVEYYTTNVGAAAMARTPIADAHMRSGSNELDDFSHGYTAAVGQIHQEEDRQPLTATNHERRQSGSDSGSPSRTGGIGDRPLWQQNRRQSRNLMWM